MRDDIVPIERGGEITYHGPGQLVVYPIVRLRKKDVRAWLRAIEAFGVAICAHFGLTATPSVDGTGVFVEHRKIASIGVAIRHWINLHGISINVAMDLQAFHAIRPCGLDPSAMPTLVEGSSATGLPRAESAGRNAAQRSNAVDLAASAHGNAAALQNAGDSRRCDCGTDPIAISSVHVKTTQSIRK